jgi:hypothetical protein
MFEWHGGETVGKTGAGGRWLGLTESGMSRTGTIG